VLTLEETLYGNDQTQWEVANEKELINHEVNGTWSLVKRTLDMEVIGCKWVLGT